MATLRVERRLFRSCVSIKEEKEERRKKTNKTREEAGDLFSAHSNKQLRVAVDIVS